MEGKKKSRGKDKDKDKTDDDEQQKEEEISSTKESDSHTSKQADTNATEAADQEVIRSTPESVTGSVKRPDTVAHTPAAQASTTGEQPQPSSPLQSREGGRSRIFAGLGKKKSKSKTTDLKSPISNTVLTDNLEKPYQIEQNPSGSSVVSKGTTKKVSGEIEIEPEFTPEGKENVKIYSGITTPTAGTGHNEIIPANNTQFGFFNTSSLPANFPCAAGLFQKRSPFIHNPPQPEERRERIACPRTPREYIINLRENLADFQESHGLPRTRDYSFFSLGLALAQETGRAIFSLFHMFTELFPILAIVSLILRFALDKLIEILETDETAEKVKKSVIFALEMIAIVIPLWILIGTIIIPLLSLLMTILKRMLRIKGKKKVVVIRQKPRPQIKTITSHK